MALAQPFFYGLVKQVGPWAQTKQDRLLGQKPYSYTPNHSVTDIYTVKAVNPIPYEQYSTKGIIYDATLSPVTVNAGKPARGTIKRAKKVVLVDSMGRVVNPTDSYFLNKYMGEMRQQAAASTVATERGFGGVADLVSEGPDSPAGSRMSVSTSAEVRGAQVDLGDLGLNLEPIEVEPVVDRGAQYGDAGVTSEVNNTQALMQQMEVDHPLSFRSYSTPHPGRPGAQESVNDPNFSSYTVFDRETGASNPNHYLNLDATPNYSATQSISTAPPEYTPNLRRRRASSTVTTSRRVRER